MNRRLSCDPVVVAQVALSLGKTAAQITAYFTPVPGLAAATDILCTIVQICQNVAQNRYAVRQLRDRCHMLLLAIADSITTTNDPMSNAVNSIVGCLMHVQTRMTAWMQISRLQAFARQNDIKQDIQSCHDLIQDCLTNFQVVSHAELHHWKEEFDRNSREDHLELIEWMSEIQHTQTIAAEAQKENTVMLRDIMSKLQTLMGETGENNFTADRRHNGLSSNLYQVQFQSGELLPNFHLNSGEVVRIGQFPVSGTAAMDIYEGLYLQHEKVAIKIVRAVNANDQSLRRFKREANIWAEIWQRDRGRHILPFYGFCQTDGPFPYMVSPWQQNGNALGYVKKHDTAVDHRQLIRGIAKGIEVLHTMTPPIVHGDIKSANIVIDPRGNPLLADFGLSRIVEDITGIPFTQSRGVSESYRWFAPEVCVGQGVLSLSSDIYAYAMTALELMTHAQPYSNIKHTTEVVIRSSRGEKPPRPTDPRVIERGLDNLLWELFNECWAIDPSARPSITQVIAKLPA